MVVERLLDLISTYGYLAVFVGTVVWGETIMLAAGFVASLPEVHISIVGVIIAGAVGTLVADSFWYFVGHSGKRGSRFLAKYEKVAFLKPALVEKITAKFHHHAGKTVFFSKFIYGTRILVLIVSGLIGVPYRKFLFYNTLSIIFWAVGVGLAGYYLGEGWLVIKGYIANAEYILLGLVVAYFLTRGVMAIRVRLKKKLV